MQMRPELVSTSAANDPLPQFLPSASDPASHPCDGSWNLRARVDSRRACCPLRFKLNLGSDQFIAVRPQPVDCCCLSFCREKALQPTKGQLQQAAVTN